MTIPTLVPLHPQDHQFDPGLQCGCIDPTSGASCTRPHHEDIRHSDMSVDGCQLSWTHLPALIQKSTGERVELSELPSDELDLWRLML